MVEKYGLEDPWELYLNGEWTWDKATEMGLKVTADTDGDGVIDQCLASDARVWDFAISNGATMTRVDENGRVVFAADDVAYIEEFELIHKWRTELKIVNSGCPFHVERSVFGFHMMSLDLPTAVQNYMFDWGMLPLPKRAAGRQTLLDHYRPSTTLIPTNAKITEHWLVRAFMA